MLQELKGDKSDDQDDDYFHRGSAFCSMDNIFYKLNREYVIMVLEKKAGSQRELLRPDQTRCLNGSTQKTTVYMIKEGGQWKFGKPRNE